MVYFRYYCKDEICLLLLYPRATIMTKSVEKITIVFSPRILPIIKMRNTLEVIIRQSPSKVIIMLGRYQRECKLSLLWPGLVLS